ncbi:MAG: hypothetical protein NT001_00135 [Candidatus Woesearchaeota archaeon]|nr:hypothetical protein [Candidatus Woesearchaeota archaeon]
MRSKKGMDMSIELIIVAALALIILIVLILIFTGQIGKARFALNKTGATYSGDKCDMPSLGRTCKYKVQCDDAGGIDYGTLDCTMGTICCSG